LYLFIFQSIGTQELILIGLVALIFLGPRKLPEYARKIGKVMSDLRKTTSEFKATWEREVDLEEEVRSLKLENIESENNGPVARIGTSPAIEEPAIKEIDPSDFDFTRPEETEAAPEPDAGVPDTESDKRTWL
jgi:sec-independent protein translocase protein TatB